MVLCVSLFLCGPTSYISHILCMLRNRRPDEMARFSSSPRGFVRPKYPACHGRVRSSLLALRAAAGWARARVPAAAPGVGLGAWPWAWPRAVDGRLGRLLMITVNDSALVRSLLSRICLAIAGSFSPVPRAKSARS